MAREFRPVDRDTPMLLSPDLREWLPEDHLAWLVIEVVQLCDLSMIEASFKRGGVGRQAYDPYLLTTLLVYAYCQGVRSSRGIERACVTDVAFRVVAAQQRPDHSTVSRFRATHAEALAGLFGQVLTLCARHGMGRVGVVAVDGARIAANASPRRSYLPDTLRKLAADIVAEAGEIDAAEDAELGPDVTGDELPAALQPGAGRAARIKEELSDPVKPPDQPGPTAGTPDQPGPTAGTPDQPGPAAEAPVWGSGAGRVVRVGEALRQAEAEEQARRRADVEAAGKQLVKARAAQQRARDRAALRTSGPGWALTPVGDLAAVRRVDERAERAAAAADKAAAGRGRRGSEPPPRRNVTDPDSRLMFSRGKGYLQGFNAQLVVSDDHLIIATEVTNQPADRGQFVPMMRQAVDSAHTHLNGASVDLILADAGYCSNNALTADGPDRLIATGRDPAKPGSSKPIAAMAKRLTEPHPDRERYKRRAATVEPVIGMLKDRIGLRRFSRRGLQAAQHELKLAATAYNIRRLATNTP